MAFEKKYPNLFSEVQWSWAPIRARFVLLDELPPLGSITNINIVPYIDSQWVILQHRDGTWDIPGGTLEVGESYLDTLRRELAEEAGANLLSYSIFGAWHCISSAAKPYRSHLAHPESYRVVGVGAIELVQPPTNPEDGEKIVAVTKVSLEEANRCFVEIGRFDLAELYRLAAETLYSDKDYHGKSTTKDNQ